MIITPKESKKQLRIVNVNQYVDHTSLFRHLVREITQKAKWCKRRELIEHWHIFCAMEISPTISRSPSKAVKK